MQQQVSYQWQRRWLSISSHPSAKHPYPIDNTGYIAGTEWGPGLAMKPVGITLEELEQDLSCVILLGEPGIGKSYEYDKLRSVLEDRIDNLFLDLGSFTTEDTLRREIEESAEVVEWQKSNAILTIWLDSLDEGLLHINRLQDGLLRVLKRLDLNRLRLRITCRNAIWPVAFTEELESRWKKHRGPTSKHVSIFLLSPLTQYQVRQAAEQEGFDAERFLSAIANVNAQPLASRPVTLQLLIDLYKDYQPTFGISESLGRAGLYERGCLTLCEKPNREREGQNKIDGRARLLLAGYLAFLAVLTNRRIIHMDPVLGNLGANELDPYAVGIGLTAKWEGIQSQISENSVRDLLKNTGLFTDVANKQMVWTHQSYAEFLAAWYLNLTKLPSISLRSIFRSSADPSGGIVPALQETAAWLTEIQPAFWNEVLDMDPMALIRSDLRGLNNEQRAALVQRLIEWLGSLAYPPYRESGESSFMQYLSHPMLADQLLPILSDPAAPKAPQRFALDMVVACKVSELLVTFLNQTLDISLPFTMRLDALNILAVLANDEAKITLRSLLKSPIPEEDVRDDFRGKLLLILWPNHISADEMFPLLSKEKDDHYVGVYRLFLDQLEKIESFELSQATVIASMTWLTNHLHKIKFQYRRERYWQTINRLVTRSAWRYIHVTAVMQVMADFFVTLNGEHAYYYLEGSTDEGRVNLFKTFLYGKNRPQPHSIVHNHSSQAALLSQTDWDIVYALINTSLSAPAREWLTRVLMFLLKQTLDNEIRAVYCQRYDQLLDVKRRYASSRKAFYSWFKVVDLDSEDAIDGREHILSLRKEERKKLIKMKRRRKDKLHSIITKRNHLQQILAKGKSATFDEWYLALGYVCSKREQTGFLSYNDISQSEGWGRLSEIQKNNLIALASEIVSRYSVPPERWYSIDKNLYSFPGIALHRALLLCHSQQVSFIQTLSVEFWRNWAPFLVQMDSYGNDHTYELSKLAASVVPEIVDSALLLKADAYEGRKENFYNFSYWYKALPVAKFPLHMLTAIKAGVWDDDFSASLLIEMLKVDFQQAWEYAQQLIQEANNVESIEREKLLISVYSWLLFKRDKVSHDAWKYWEHLSCNPSLAETIIEKSVSIATRGDLYYLASFGEHELHSFILWLTYAFSLTPDDKDNWKDKSPKGNFVALRNEAVIELASRGTELAWQILEQLSEQMGQPFWLRFRIDQVRENLRRNMWNPISSDALIKLSQASNRRWVKSARDLQELILESLSRFQADLHNELIAAEVLWLPLKDPTDERKTLGYKVRDENFLSNVIRRHLVQDLRRSDILVKREVEIRPSFGAKTGQRTDIYIDAFTMEKGDNTDIVTVVIEVKLSKNDEVEEALNGQLVPYLKDQSYKHGIYIVGWHYGEHDPKPLRNKSLPDLHALLKVQTHAANTDYTIKTMLLDIRLPADKERSSMEDHFFIAI